MHTSPRPPNTITLKKTVPLSDASRKWEIALRTALVFPVGYVVVSLYTASLSLVVPMPSAQAVLASTMLSFALYSVFIIWAYAASALRKVVLVALIAAAFPTVHLLCTAVIK
ncbi:hypothetical protein [Pusillimonas sp. ANT_WB101]|uniref:hypothetical protein n=1 Tax=Pusillimonas sp. ANT_WB101 TaxID=2597356 RepID=UPI0011EBAF1D|nr:hypothetical protein [Pusillimonas sp. ANT_WB101]KAA0911176.1 hypothetical protein FQ179_04810 [Pusillimonas sp. ANT_WB101]